MKPFTALDEVLNTRSLTPAPSRPASAPAPEFQPLFAAPALTPMHGPPVGAESHDSPQIELVQENGIIRQIIVTCRCGERTVMDCAY